MLLSRTKGLERRMFDQSIEVSIEVEKGNIGTNSDSGDQTIHEFAHGTTLLATGAIERSGDLEIGRLRGDNRCAGEKPPELL